MQEFEFLLTDEEFESVEGLTTEFAAVEICRVFFRKQNPKVTFPRASNGADLHVLMPDAPGVDIEAKGTQASDIAWQQIRVSSQQSHDRLKAGMPLYRVSNIGSRKVKIHVMKYGEDFEMTHEPRWRVHKPNSR
jgi:hypothetical protein